MSVSKWRYTEECNGRPCPGDCDHCSFELADLISRADAVKAIRKCKFDSDMPSDWYRGMECAWKNKFVNAEKRTEELYDETMGKVANECKTCKERLQNLRPSAEAVQGWIPCSDRLPKAEDMYQPPEQRYLCQLETHGMRKFCVLSRLKGAVSPFWDWYGIAVYDSEVIAWMPLPKPYKGGDDE